MTRQELIDQVEHHAQRADELMRSLDVVLGNDEILLDENTVEAIRLVTAGAHAYAVTAQAFAALCETTYGQP